MANKSGRKNFIQTISCIHSVNHSCDRSFQHLQPIYSKVIRGVIPDSSCKFAIRCNKASGGQAQHSARKPWQSHAFTSLSAEDHRRSKCQTLFDNVWLIYISRTYSNSNRLNMILIDLAVEWSLEVKLPTILTNGKAEVGRIREEKRSSEKMREEKESEERRPRCKKVGKSRFTVFLRWFVAPEGRKVGSLKRPVRSPVARWEMKNCTPLWREAHFEAKM